MIELKKLEQEKPWSPKAKSFGILNKPLKVYGEDIFIPPRTLK